MSDHDIESNVNGIKVSATIDLDWRALGKEFASISADEQAGFLESMRNTMTSWGPVRMNSQLNDIAAALPHESSRWDEVGEMLDTLVHYIGRESV